MYSGSILHSIPHALVSVVVMAPLMNRKAWFCTLSNVARFVCVAVLRAALLYSRVGLTEPLYSCRSVCLFAPHLVLASFLTIFNRRLAFAAVFSMCFLIESFWSSCRPRYCGTSSFCIASPPYLIFTLFSTLYLLEKMVYTVLFVLSFSFHRLQYVHRLRRLVLTLACALYVFALVDQSTRLSA